jgi:hypothetical protein
MGLIRTFVQLCSRGPQRGSAPDPMHGQCDGYSLALAVGLIQAVTTGKAEIDAVCLSLTIDALSAIGAPGFTTCLINTPLIHGRSTKERHKACRPHRSPWDCIVLGRSARALTPRANGPLQFVGAQSISSSMLFISHPSPPRDPFAILRPSRPARSPCRGSL